MVGAGSAMAGVVECWSELSEIKKRGTDDVWRRMENLVAAA
jgi:hypothetical protein